MDVQVQVGAVPLGVEDVDVAAAQGGGGEGGGVETGRGERGGGDAGDGQQASVGTQKKPPWVMFMPPRAQVRR
jgi:hypothetical protein